MTLTRDIGPHHPSPSIRLDRYPESLGYFSYSLFPSERAHTIQITAMCEAFRQLGVSTTLFACRNPLRPGVSEEGLLDEYSVEDRFDVRLFDAAGGVWALRRLSYSTTRRTCREFDLCFTRDVIPALACAVRRAPCILEVHNFNLGVTDRTALTMLKRSPHIRLLAISDALAHLISEHWGIARDRIAVEHDAFRVPTQASAETPQLDYDMSRGRLKSVYVGSFYAGRGVELVYRLAELHPTVDFILVGAPNDHALPAGTNSNHNLFVFPRVPHSSVPAILQMGDILLMPYGRQVTIDGHGDTSQFCSPLKLFEYLGAGRAIIASRLPSTEEVLRDGDNALLAAPDDEAEWSSRIAELKDNPELRQRLARSALGSSAQYTWRRRAQRILQGLAND